MIDQPSQVYFPKKPAGSRTAKDLDLDEDDAMRVRKLFLELQSVSMAEKNAKRDRNDTSACA
jgi:Protein of unknown function (DUF3732)